MPKTETAKPSARRSQAKARQSLRFRNPCTARKNKSVRAESLRISIFVKKLTAVTPEKYCTAASSQKAAIGPNKGFQQTGTRSQAKSQPHHTNSTAAPISRTASDQGSTTP